MTDIKELWSREDWEVFKRYDNCKSSEERKKMINEDHLLQESDTDIKYPYVDMSVEEFCAKYNLIERDEFRQ